MSSSDRPSIESTHDVARLIIEIQQLHQRLAELEHYILTTREATLIMTRAGEDYLRLKRSRPTKSEGRDRI